MKTVVDFPERRVVAEEAAEWLIRLDADTAPTRDELQALGEWLRRSPVHREEIEGLAALWGRMNVLTELAVPLGYSSPPTPRSWFVCRPAGVRSWRMPGLIAGSLAVVLALALLMVDWQSGIGSASRTNGWYATAVGEQETTTLADGSRVILNTNSEIKVDYTRDYRRVRLLRGEAFFIVAKDAERPFRVYAGGGRIEALGTAFSVYLNGAQVSIAVSEGRVLLASAQHNVAQLSATSTESFEAAGSGPDFRDDLLQPLATLEAGHATRIRASPEGTADAAGALQAIQVVAPAQLEERLAWRNGILVFSGETLEEVVKEFSRYTTVSIEIPDAQVRAMRVGGRFPVGETDTMLAALATNFNLRVTRVADDHVVLSAADN